MSSILIRCTGEFYGWLTMWGHMHGLSTSAAALDGLREFVTSETSRAEYVQLGRAEKYAKPLKGKKIKKSVYS